jgi:4-hydroxy-tetrahydrodipicolinate synthase
MAHFHGIFPYLVSPVNADGTIRESVLRDLVEHLIQCGVHGLTPLGSTGEFFYLSHEQRRKIVEIVVDQTKHRVPVVAGVAASNSLEACQEAQEFERMGVEGILSVLTVYFPLKQDEIYAYFADVARSVTCPVLLYNNPKFTGFDISVDTLTKLSEIPNICCYKDASPNTGKLLELSLKVGDSLDIFSASAHVPLFVMMLGGKGWMAGPACVIPRESVQLYQLCVEKKWDEAMVLQRKLWSINSVFQRYGLAGCIKAALTLQGFDVGDPIKPRKALTEAAREEIKQAILSIRGTLEP